MAGFREAKIFDFHIFFDAFLRRNLSFVSDRLKIEKKAVLGKVFGHFGSNLRNVRPPGERKREGSRSLSDKR